MIYYELVKVTINAPGFTEVIIDVVVRHHGPLDSIITNHRLLFTSKFWSLLCYFFNIKWRLSTIFYPQIDGRTKRQNSMIEAYLRVFVNFKQNDLVRLLPMAEFAYNNAKNASTSYTPFKLNCRYHFYISYKEDFDPRSKLKTAEKLSFKFWELITIC